MKTKIMNKLVAVALIMLAVGETCSFAGFVGMNYGPYHKPGQTPERPDDPALTDDQYREDLGKIAAKFGYIRTYGCEPRVAGLLPFIASNYPSLKVWVGVYESKTYRGNRNNRVEGTEMQLDRAIELAKKYPSIVEGIVVGNECLDRDAVWDGGVSFDTLKNDIKYVKDNVPSNVKVGTCMGFLSALNPSEDPDGVALRSWLPAQYNKDYGSYLMKENYVDFLMVTIYPFYAGESLRDPNGVGERTKPALFNTTYWYDYAVKKIANGKPVIFGEVGWPTEGPDQVVGRKTAVANVANAETYTTDIIEAVKTGRLGSTFIFEAFDEAWKPGTHWEKHWGLWTSDGTAKFNIPSGH